MPTSIVTKRKSPPRIPRTHDGDFTKNEERESGVLLFFGSWLLLFQLLLDDERSEQAETYAKGGKAYVSVKDAGCGISAEDQKKIWNRFYKGDASRGAAKNSTGLGLAICREIIHHHGQTIDVISTEGVGSEFIFTLKAAEREYEEL